MKRSGLLILIALALLLASEQSWAVQHKGQSERTHKAIKEQQPQIPEIPLTVLESVQTALSKALSTIKQQAITAQKQAEAYKETYCSPPVVVNGILAFVGFGYLVFMGLQLSQLKRQNRTANNTLLRQFRPRLIVRHVGLLTEPDKMLVADDEGSLQAVPIDAVLIIANDGGTQAEIIDGNITLRVLGGDVGGLQEWMKHRPLLPQFDTHSGLPVYGEDPVILTQHIIKPGDRQIIKQTMPVPETTAGKVRAYLATHPTRNVESMALIAFGYFKYRDEMGSSYTTAFCRRYDRGKGRFIVVDEPDYEYRD